MIWRTLRALGVFALTRRLTGNALRILCYHGASLEHEHEFRPTLFMRPETFRRRLAMIKRLGYPVLPLNEAVERLRDGSLPASAVAITIDDGWAGTAMAMAPALQEHAMPATLYVASRELQDAGFVFNVTAQYLLWRNREHTIDLAQLDASLQGRYDLRIEAQRDAVGSVLVGWATTRDDSARNALLRSLARALDADLDALSAQRMFRFMTQDEARALANFGIDVQLHTHDHDLSLTDRDHVTVQIAANRAALASVATSPLNHFCYPSGIHHVRQFPWLAALDIASATTCEPGFNYRDTHPLGLNRILDGENLDDIEIEAELAGVPELLRRLRGGKVGYRRSTPVAAMN